MSVSVDMSPAGVARKTFVAGVGILTGLAISAFLLTVIHFIFKGVPVNSDSRATLLIGEPVPVLAFAGLAGALACIGLALDLAGANIVARALPRLALLCFMTAVVYPPLPMLGLIMSMVLMVIAPLGAGVWRQPVMLLWSWAMAISVGVCLWLGRAKIAPGTALQFAVGALVLWLIASAFALIRSGRAGPG